MTATVRTSTQGWFARTTRNARVKGHDGCELAPFNNLRNGCGIDDTHGTGTTSNGQPFHVGLSGIAKAHTGVTLVAIALGRVLGRVIGGRVDGARRLVIFRSRLYRLDKVLLCVRKRVKQAKQKSP
jgi:hypothetical protein